MSEPAFTISRTELHSKIREAARSVAQGQPEGQDFLDRLAEVGLADEVLLPSTRIHTDGEIETAVVLYRSFLAQRSRPGDPRGTGPLGISTAVRPAASPRAGPRGGTATALLGISAFRRAASAVAGKSSRTRCGGGFQERAEASRTTV